MKIWKHLTFEQRKVITNGISRNYKLKEIADALGYDATSISKEVKRNREPITIGTNITNCKKVNRWPFVCTGCNKRYNINAVLLNINTMQEKLKIKQMIN